MNLKLARIVEQANTALQTAKAFVETYGDEIPEDLGHLSICGAVHFTVFVETWERNKKELTIKKMGEIFGVGGWTEFRENNRVRYSKDVVGVTVKIDIASQLCASPPVSLIQELAAV